MFKLLQLLCAVTFGFVSLHGATIAAASGSLADLNTAISSASDGDTVTVPSGTWTWTDTASITKNIDLIGAGAGSTIILDNVSRAQPFPGIIAWETSESPRVRLSGFTFGNSPSMSDVGYSGAVWISGDCKAVIVDNCHFDELNNANMTLDGVYGVVYSNRFDQGWNNGVTVTGSGYGDASWASAPEWGTTNRVYIEDNTFVYAGAGFGPGVNDGFSGARVVFRYNSVTNLFIQGHGTESAQRRRGCRLIEAYMNRLTSTTDTGTGFYLRSGSGVIFSNVLTGFTYGSFASLNNFRSTGHFTPWQGAYGNNSWDSNNASGILDSGTHTGGNATAILTDSGGGWTADQWVGAGYVVKNTTGGESASNPFSQISDNTATTISTTIAYDGSEVLWDTGDSYVIRQVLIALDQIGRGSGDLLSGDTPSNSVLGGSNWPRQVSEPLYQWDNTFNGSAATMDSQYSVLQEDRDFYNGTEMPGYTPLTYPHPLRGEEEPPEPPAASQRGSIRGKATILGKGSF